MLRHKPKLKYCGLTIVMSNPSRFDKVQLLSSSGGDLFLNKCLQPDYNLMQCDVRLVDDMSPLLEDTKCLLLMGDAALHRYCPTTTKNNIHEMRGSLLLTGPDNMPCIPTYLPQEAADFKSYEKQFNEEAKGFEDEDVEDEDEGEGDLKGMQATKRSNYAFWLYRDTWKAKQCLLGGHKAMQARCNNSSSDVDVKYVTRPPTDTVLLPVLRNTKGGYLYFDIETDYEEQNLLCFSFTFDGATVYNVPVLDYNYKWFYPDLPRIMQALAIACRDNTVVAHNGASFDFFVLAHKYKIVCRKVYDTMLAMHRCFPAVEKSLGHCISYWTWLRFHKDEDSHSYRNLTDMESKMSYCGKDVYGMYLVHKAIEAYAKTIPGLEASIECAMRSIVPYLTTTLQGIRYDPDKIQEITSENDKLMMQYIRLCEFLIGKSGMAQIKSCVKHKNAGPFPGSRIQVCHYFHEILGYPVIFRSSNTGEPSLGKKTLFKLQLKHDNPVIQIINLYRKVQKETGTLKFNPWKDDNNRVLPRFKFKDKEDTLWK